MLKIITDSAGDMPPDWGKEFDFHIIPVNIHIGDQTYLQGVDLSDAEFYERAEKTGVIPKTSQPSPHQFITFYRQIASPGDTILSIHITSQLSGTFASAQMAARELEGEFNIIPFDSKAGSAAQAFMCREARELDRAGASLEEILQRLVFIRDHIQIVLTLDTLEYARMSGRVKTLQAALASMLNIKPIIDLQNGVLDMTERVRTRKRALDRLLEMIEERVGSQPINAAIVQSMDPKTGEILRKLAELRFQCHELIVTELSIAIAANLGPGTVGMIAYPTGEGM
jgi:DegV family protein with EDD domain